MSANDTFQEPTDASSDHDLIMKSNALEVFSEPDAAKRIAALQRLWAPEATLFESDSATAGHPAICTHVGSLLATLPPGTRFAPNGDAAGHHDLFRLRWIATGSDGTSLGVSGMDVAVIRNNRIERLHVILD